MNQFTNSQIQFGGLNLDPSSGLYKNGSLSLRQAQDILCHLMLGMAMQICGRVSDWNLKRA